jgi:hypothetical protein
MTRNDRLVRNCVIAFAVVEALILAVFIAAALDAI